MKTVYSIDEATAWFAGHPGEPVSCESPDVSHVMATKSLADAIRFFKDPDSMAQGVGIETIRKGRQ